MESVALEDYRLVYGRLPEINAAVAEVAGFSTEPSAAPDPHHTRTFEDCSARSAPDF
jgi:hypothetical protein